MKWILADSVDPDQTPQTPQNAATDQGLHCSRLMYEFHHLSVRMRGGAVHLLSALPSCCKVFSAM